MTHHPDFEIFLATAPGLEPTLAEEVALKAFKRPKPVPGGVITRGTWPDIWRANLWIRGATRILARLDAFHVTHLAHLDGRARRTPWADILRPDTPFRVEATCHKSRIYHSGAAAERIATAIHATTGAPHDPDAEVTVMARIDHDLCTLSIDTSGEPLHKRGFKAEVNAAPLRETLAALFLRQCGFDGSEPVLDPMCGSGTFVIEAAEIAARLNPGRARHFAFERLATFDAEAWARLREPKPPPPPPQPLHRRPPPPRAGALSPPHPPPAGGGGALSRANPERAGVAAITEFHQAPISEARPPEGPPGLVITNPPYGTRLGEAKSLAPLYQALGRTLAAHFQGWRIGLVAADPKLAHATGLPFLPSGPPVPHGGLRVTLFRTAPLG